MQNVGQKNRYEILDGNTKTINWNSFTEIDCMNERQPDTSLLGKSTVAV